MSNQAKVGILALIALLALSMLVFWKSAIFLDVSGYEMIGSFENVEGLTVGSEIRYRGFKVGKVMRIDPGVEDIRVYCFIDNGIKFTIDSYLRVAFDGLVGLKYLEVRPGKSADIYKPGQLLYGQKTSGIVDFIDIGAQNLVEFKQILVAIKDVVTKPSMQNAVINGVMNFEKASIEINKLTRMLQDAVASINMVIADPGFQSNFKETVAGTSKTLTSANTFFENTSKIRIKPSGDILIGGIANQVKGNLDIKTGDNNYLRMSMGEGPTRNLALLDLQLASVVANNLGLRLGTINTHLGGGIDYQMNDRFMLSGDLYDINNPKPSLPKVRVTGEYQFVDYVNLLIQADDFLNSGNANYSVGVRVKGRE